MIIYLHSSEKQIQDLSVSVSAFQRDAQEIGTLVADNKRLLSACHRRMECLRLATNKTTNDIESLEEALADLDIGNLDAAHQHLSRVSTAILEDSLLEKTSLQFYGPITSGADLIDLLLDQKEMDSLRQYLNRSIFERLKWTKGDYLVCGGCVLIGMALELLNMAWRPDSSIDSEGQFREWFNKKLHHHGADSPIDYQGTGFGGDLHRVRSEGHDLTRFFEAVEQTSKGEFHGVRWSYGIPVDVISKVNHFGKAYPTMPWTAAFINVLVHLFADFFSKHSLPMPLSSVIYEHTNREMRTFVHDLYAGGFNLRHVAIGGLEVLLSSLAIETWLWLQYGPERKSDSVSLKRYEMRGAVMGLLSGANIAGAAVFSNPFLLNIPTLIAAMDSAIHILFLRAKQHNWVLKVSRNIDELVIQWNQLSETYQPVDVIGEIQG